MQESTLAPVQLFTDGACKGNPGPGGWGFVLLGGGKRLESCGGETQTTNNRMEMMAALMGLRSLKAPCKVELWTDSKYLQQGITQWIHNWKRKGWKTASGAPVKNVDLWRDLDDEASSHSIDWKWVKGHAGHKENERCDSLAVHGAEQAAQGLTETLEGRPALVLPAGKGKKSTSDQAFVPSGGCNIELKLELDDLDEVKRSALALGAKDMGTLEQRDQFFYSPPGTRLKLRREKVGARESAFLISYCRPDEGEARASDWRLSQQKDPDALEAVLEQALGKGVLVEKSRQLLLLGPTRLHLDRVGGLGTFVELERVLQDGEEPAAARQEVDRLLDRLNLGKAKVLAHAYADMLLDLNTGQA